MPEPLRRRLPQGLARLLEEALAAATAEGEALYLVGGALRDWLRQPRSRRAIVDLDLALEGDVARLAGRLEEQSGARARRHARFATATLLSDEGAARLDIARTRRERYPRPAALPRVRGAPIEEDLARRDFSVNALALGLSGPRTGELLDPFGGEEDLRRGRIRVLQTRSFRDDPTRLLRACRYAARLEGRLERATARLARRDRGGLLALSAERRGQAWRELLQDPAAGGALRVARRLGLAEASVRGWRIPEASVRRFEAMRGEPAERFWTIAGVGATGAESAALDALPGTLRLRASEREALRTGRALRAARFWLGRPQRRPGEIAARLGAFPDPALEAAGRSWRGPAGSRIRSYMRRRAQMGSPLEARQLLALGVPEGAALGAWLAALEGAAWDGLLPARGAVAAAERWVASSPDEPSIPTPES